MLMIINNPALFIKIIMPVVAVTTALSMVVAGITLGVIIGKLHIFSTDKIVLQSPATIALNRFIEPYELALFNDAVGTLDILLEDIKRVLTERFGSQFVTVQFESFSPTPTVTSNNAKELKSNKRYLGEVKSPSIIPTTTSTTSAILSALAKYETTNYTTNTTSFDNYTTDSISFENCTTAFIMIKNCTGKDTTDSWVNMIVSIENCTNITNPNDILNCLNITVPVCESTSSTDKKLWDMAVPAHSCSHIENDTIDCGNIKIEFPNCFNQSMITQNISSSTTVNNTTLCDTPQNTTGQPSIILSTMILFFQVENPESISAEEIIDALKNLNPPITLITRCQQPSSRLSSFNTTLSKVEPPTKSDLTLQTLKSQPSIPTSLQDAVSAGAASASNSIFGSSTTASSATSAQIG